MKRNFLLMLLMTLLPLAGWAVDVKIGDYTAKLDYQYVELTDPTTGVAAPQIQILKNATPITGTALDVYDAEGNVVEGKIKEAGAYYSFIKIEDNGTKTIKVPFRVYVASELTELEWSRVVAGEDYGQEEPSDFWEFNYTNPVFEELMDEENPGAYYYYFQEYQWCDIWVHKNDYQDSEQNMAGTGGYVLYPGDTYDENLMPVTTGRFARNADGSFVDKTQEDLNDWAQSVLQDGVADHDWNAVRKSNPDNIVFTVEGEKSVVMFKYGNGDAALYATPWGNRAFGSEFKKYGLFSVRGDFPVEFAWTTAVPEFAEDDLSIYTLPYVEDFEGSVLSNEPGEYTIQVTPISGVRMPYGGEIDLSPANAKNVISLTPIEYNTIPGLKEAIMEAGVLQVNGIDGDINPENWKKLTPGTYTYSLGIFDKDGNGTIEKEETLVTLEGDARTFIIDPILDGQVIIEAGQNDFAKDEEGNFILPVLKTGLVYTAASQSLVEANTGKTAFGTAIEYLVLSETEVVFDAEDQAKRNPAIPENIVGLTWLPTAERVNAGKYYVWARAAAAPAGGDDEGNWEAGVAHLLSVAAEEGNNNIPDNFATIAKATPTIVGPIALTPAGLGEENKYFLSKNPNGVTVAPSGAKVQFNGQDLAGATITYVTWNPENAQGASTNFTYTAVGNYKIQARFVAEGELANNFENVVSQTTPVEVAFKVAEKPTVTVTPNSPQLIGQGTDPVFANDTIWEDGEKGNLEGTAQYFWYYDEACNQRVWNSHPAAGEYWVKINGGLTSTTHKVEYGKLKVLVTSGDIEAEIANYDGTENDALIYGQPLPLKLKHITGLPEAQVRTFENQEYTNGEFTAKLIKDAEGKAVLDGPETKLYRAQNGLYTALPVGTYKVTATIGTTNTNWPTQNPTNGFNIFVDGGEWKVVAKDITNEDTGTEGIYVYGLGDEFDYTKEYAGEAIIPTAAELNAGDWGINYRYAKLTFDTEDAEGNLVKGDLKVTPVEGKNNINAGDAWFKIEGQGNFTGEKEMQFTITKATVAVRPAANQTWTVGTPEVDENGKSIYKLDVDDINRQLKGQDQTTEAVPATDGKPAVPAHTGLDITTAPGFRMLAVKRISSTTAGNHEGGLQAYKTDAELGEEQEFAPNYNFTFNNANADLVINQGVINLKVKDVTVTYAGKENKPTIEYGFEPTEGTTLSDLMKKDGNWQRLVTGLNGITWVREDEMTGATPMEYNANTYENFFGCDLETVNLTATNYTVTVTDNQGDLIIAPQAVTLKAANQGPMALEVVDEKFNTVASVDGDKPTVVKVTGEIHDPIAELVEIQKPSVIKVGENEITLVKANNSNYTITTQPGTLFVGSGNDPLVLALTSQMEDIVEPVVGLQAAEPAANSDETTVAAEIKTITKPGDWSKLKAYEGVPVDKITLQLKPATLSGNADFSAWNADEWHAMVLPFEITVKELSKAFDYAYVNVVDPTATKANDVRFKLANILDVIPANTPFCIKASVPYEYETRTTEGDVTEVTPAQTLEFIPTTTGEGKFTVDLTGIATEGEGAWTVAGVDADKENLGYKFAGIYDELTIDKDTKDALRFLGTVGGVNKWYYIGDASSKTCTLPPYTGFVNLGAKTADVREVTFTFEEEDGSTTSIKAVDFFNGNKANAEGLYRVDGVKVQSTTTQKGVYVQDGKKFVK